MCQKNPHNFNIKAWNLSFILATNLLCRRLSSIFPHWGEIICLFYSWVSFWGLKGKDWQCTCGLPLKEWPRKRGERGERLPESFLGSANHFSSHLSASLWALTHTDPPPHRFRLKFLHSARPCASVSSPSARHTPRGIQNALTPNQWETVKKQKKKV